jgi:hypothetical protein
MLTTDGAGKANGLVTTVDGTRNRVTGQIDGQSLSLVFYGVDYGQLYGVGVGDADVRGCKGEVRGILLGPRDGDVGDWHLDAPAPER